MIYILVIHFATTWTVGGKFNNATDCITLAKSISGGACYEIEGRI